ncbi:ASCH domain-containing protein [Paenibacillus sp. S-38]|uniref:ASCH domain-containing protein n=1 Tax=Paenibacillus sp. S-38 TaxID=3416710 RepID=UPI003CF685A8
MSYDPSVHRMWEKFVETSRKNGVQPRSYKFVFRFGDNKESSDGLLSLVLQRRKPTAYSPWFFEHDGQPLPQVGDYSIVTNWEGIPRCIIQTVHTRTVPFIEVDEEFAKMEGEGDLSQSYWRMAHESYLSRECKRTKNIFSHQMPVFCEVFTVVFEQEVLY